MSDHSDDALGAEAALPPSAYMSHEAGGCAPPVLSATPAGPWYFGSSGLAASQFDDGAVSIAIGTDRPSRERSALLLTADQAKQLAGFFRLLQTDDRPPSVLDEARNIVHGDRERTHGEPAHNLRAIAGIWTALLAAVLKPGSTVTPEIVSLMMIGLKLARACNQPSHRDHWTDIAGYVALAERCGYVAPK